MDGIAALIAFQTLGKGHVPAESFAFASGQRK